MDFNTAVLNHCCAVRDSWRGLAFFLILHMTCLMDIHPSLHVCLYHTFKQWVCTFLTFICIDTRNNVCVCFVSQAHCLDNNAWRSSWELVRRGKIKKKHSSQQKVPLSSPSSSLSPLFPLPLKHTTTLCHPTSHTLSRTHTFLLAHFRIHNMLNKTALSLINQ